MREFWLLFKHELKMLFPLFGYNKKRKHDIFGGILSLALTAFVAIIFVVLLTSLARGYLEVRVDKVLNPSGRAVELLNILYVAIMLFMIVLCLQKMNQTLTSKSNKEIYLRLPVKKQTLLMSSLSALLVWTILTSLLIVLPINIIFAITLEASFWFFAKTLFVCFFMPFMVFGISILLLIPFLLIKKFLQDRYFINFILLTSLVIAAFLLYSKVLKVIQTALQTGSIKFLFNEHFVNILQRILKFSFPANLFANLMLSRNLIGCIVLILVICASLGALGYFISGKIYSITLYSHHEHHISFTRKHFKKSNPLISLIKKEFISVYRNPEHLFSYFTVAVAMPVFVYCCFSLFKSLIINAFGLEIVFPLALLVLLIFSILTNTFCATNISRDKLSFLKIKTLPVSPSVILWAKVLFCAVVSVVSISLSVILLLVTKQLGFVDGLICAVIVISFSIAQILIATKIDLRNTKLSSTSIENQSTSNKTMTKVVCIGLIVALAMGIISVMIFILAKGSISNFINSLNLKIWHCYAFPILICIIYFILSVVFYKHDLNTTFDNLS